MKTFIVLCTLYIASHAQLQFAPPMASTRLGSDGTSSITQFHRNDNNGNYDFGYNEGHNEGGTFRRERGDAFGRKVGTYGYTNNEGLIRIVNYVADENGFRAELKSTEPGVEEREPASVIVFKEDTPTLMTYPGPEAASVPDPSGAVPGASSIGAASSSVVPVVAKPAPALPIPYGGPASGIANGARVQVNAPFGSYSYSY